MIPRQASQKDQRILVLLCLALTLTLLHFLQFAPSEKTQAETIVAVPVWRTDQHRSGFYLVPAEESSAREHDFGLPLTAARERNPLEAALWQRLPAHIYPFFFLPLPLNQADAQLLTLLPGIGPKTAEKIIAHRTRYGSFTDVNELKEIDGIGEKSLERLVGKVAVFQR